MNPSTSPTPRTDAIQYQGNPVSPTIQNKMLRALSRRLERELAEKTNEVARLNKEIVRLKAIIEGGDFIPAGFHHRPSFREGVEFAEDMLERRIQGIKKRLELDSELASANHKIHELETNYRTLCWLKEESDKSPSPFKTWEDAMLNRGSYVQFYSAKADEANGRAYKAEVQNQKLRELLERAIEEMEGGDPVGAADQYREELNQLTK